MWILCRHRLVAPGFPRLRASILAIYPTWLCCRLVRRPTKRSGVMLRLGLDWLIRRRKASAGRLCFEVGSAFFMIWRLHKPEALLASWRTLLQGRRPYLALALGAPPRSL